MPEEDQSTSYILFGLMAVPVGVALIVTLLVVSLLLTSVAQLTGGTEDDAVAAVEEGEDSAETPPASSEAGGAPVAGTSIAAAAPQNGRVVLVDADGRLITVAPDGSDERLLVDSEQRFQFPAWSPDGQSVAAIGVGSDQSGVYVYGDCDVAASCDVDLDAILYETQRNLPIYLSWAPDSSAVSFIANAPVGGLALYSEPRDGGIGSEPLATGQPLYWDWSGDSAELLIHTGGNSDSARLEVIDLAGSSLTDQLAPPGYFQSPDVSADNQYFAYAVENDIGTRELVISQRDGSRQQSTRHAGSVALAWSPTANQLAYISSAGRLPSSYGPLQLLDATTGVRRLLNDELVLAFFWSPDGEKIAFIAPQLPENLPEVDVARDRMARLGPVVPVQGDEPLTLNLWVVDVASNVTERWGSFAPNPLFVTQFLPFFDQYARSHSLWSPDSSELLLPVVEDGRSKLYRFSADSVPQLVRAGVSGFWSSQ